MAKRNWVHHNYFLDFGKGAPNNASGLHFGSSHRSMDPGYSVAEYNLFVRNIGENEGAICSKTTDAIYRFNTIVDSTELSLRHGHRARSTATSCSTAAACASSRTTTRSTATTSRAIRPAIAIGNGGATIPPGPLTSHQKPDRVKVVYNTLVNNRATCRWAAARNGLGADDLVFANNIIQGGNKAVTIAGPLKDPKWEGNIIWNTEGGAGDMPTDGLHAGRSEAGQGRPRRLPAVATTAPRSARASARYPFVTIDIDGQPRPADKLDVGADQFSTEPRPQPPADRSRRRPERAGGDGSAADLRAGREMAGRRRTTMTAPA